MSALTILANAVNEATALYETAAKEEREARDRATEEGGAVRYRTASAHLDATKELHRRALWRYFVVSELEREEAAKASTGAA